MTLEAWVKPSTVSSSWRDVIYKGNDNYFLEGTSSNSSVPAGGGTFGGASGLVVGSSSLTVNTWSHLALTYDGATLRLYVNGVQVSSVAQTGNLLTSTNPLQIGGDSIFGQYFAGTIDEVRVYNTALNQAQVQSDMGIPVGGGSGPLVSLSPTSINFGNVPTGTTSSAVPVTLSNVGSAPLTINSIAISGGNVGDFAQSQQLWGKSGGRELLHDQCQLHAVNSWLTYLRSSGFRYCCRQSTHGEPVRHRNWILHIAPCRSLDIHPHATVHRHEWRCNLVG